MIGLGELGTWLLVAAVAGGLATSCSKSETKDTEPAKARGLTRAAMPGLASATTLAGATAGSKAIAPGSPASCLACENEPGRCQEFLDCDAVLGEAVPSSPAAGTPKSKLCREVLECVRSSGCAAGNGIIKCYCGTAGAEDCQSGHANGVCKKQLERGLEATTFTQVARHLKDPKFGGGMAMARIDCDQQVCGAQCNLH